MLPKAPILWIAVGVYAVTRSVARTYEDAFPTVEFTGIGVIGGFLTIALVFFNGYAYSRFTSLYAKSMATQASIFEVAVISKGLLPSARARRLVRYLNAAHVLAYVGLSDAYNEDNFLRPLNDKHRLLSEEEYARMLEIDPKDGGTCYREALSWAMLEIEQAAKAGEIDPGVRFTAFQLDWQVLGVQNAVQVLYHYLEQPFSFFHLHLIFFLTSVYLPLFTYSNALSLDMDTHWTNEVASGCLVLMTCVMVVGLRFLAQILVDPYGSDVEDLSVIHFVEFTWRASRQILITSDPKPLDPELEDRLVAQRERHVPAGKAWMSEKYVKANEDSRIGT